MISCWRIFWLELLSLIRSRTLPMLLAASAVWMLALPALMRTDGTDEGAWRLYVQYSLGGVLALLVVALASSATGSVARERTAKRLQLTLVRPVPYAFVALGKIWAHVAAGAAVLAVACAILLCRADVSRPCCHVLSPLLPSPREEAQAMYETYMSDPATPDEVRRADKQVVLRLLQQRASDRYESVATNATAAWRFGFSGCELAGLAPKVRMRFTNPMEMRQDVQGVFRLDGWSAQVTNVTQAILEFPLCGGNETLPDSAELVFENRGKTPLMFRPRKDVNVLLPADGFGMNLLRAYAAMVALLAIVVSACVFLSCALGRPVALFAAMAMMAVGEMSPSVVEQYPDQLETDRLDRIGLHIARCAAAATHPVSSLQPLSALAADECIEPPRLAWMAFFGLLAIPLALSALAGFVIPRKQDDLV